MLKMENIFSFNMNTMLHVSPLSVFTTITLTLLQKPTHTATLSDAGLVNCSQSTFTAGYANIPPYSFMKEGSTQINGAIAHIATKAVEKCCGANVSIDFISKFSKIRDVEEQLTTEHIAFPAVKTGLTIVASAIDGYYFLPVMETTGSMLVFDKTRMESSPIGHALLACWPILILVITSAGVAGILVWILDRYWNPADFPKPFFSGCWEGTWWAYVTMTTVGYGDRAPKSIPARLFGLVWMFVGIIVMSIFTATLTTALTSNEVQEFHMKGSKIGVLRGSLEQLMAYREGSIVIGYPTFKAMVASLQNGTVEALLLDINFALFLIEDIETEQLALGEQLENKAVYGIIFQGQPDLVEQCFAKQVSKSQFMVFDELINHLGIYHKEEKNQAGQTTNQLMTGLYTVITVMSGLWGVAFLFAIAWECLYHRPKMRREGKKIDNYCMCCFKQRTTSVESIPNDKTGTVNSSIHKEKL